GQRSSTEPSARTILPAPRASPRPNDLRRMERTARRWTMDVGEHRGRGILKSIEAAGDVQVERSLIGMVNGHDVAIARGACGPVVAGVDVTLLQAGCRPLVAKGDVRFEQGGCQSVIAGGGVTVGPSSFVGVALAPRITVEEGGRVLLGVPQALAFGAAFGLAAGLVRWMVHRASGGR